MGGPGSGRRPSGGRKVGMKKSLGIKIKHTKTKFKEPSQKTMNQIHDFEHAWVRNPKGKLIPTRLAYKGK
jgi:hypothetical protein